MWLHFRPIEFEFIKREMSRPNLIEASLMAQLVKNPQVDSWAGKIHWRRDRLPTPVFLGFPFGSAGKESACNVGDLGLIPGLGRSPGEGKCYPLQYSCLENSMDYGPRGHKESDSTERPSPDFSASSLTYLQSILCIEARVNCLVCKWGHIIPLLKILQWPPSFNRVKHKILQWSTRPCRIYTWILLAPSLCSGSA